jgi:hypothetical protein
VFVPYRFEALHERVVRLDRRVDGLLRGLREPETPKPPGPIPRAGGSGFTPGPVFDKQKKRSQKTFPAFFFLKANTHFKL